MCSELGEHMDEDDDISIIMDDIFDHEEIEQYMVEFATSLERIEFDEVMETTAHKELEDILEEDLNTYNKKTIETEVLDPLIRKQGGAPPAKKAHGILGFVRFLKGFYIILITARKKVAKIGLHTIYTI